MKIGNLQPRPTARTKFALSHLVTVPEKPGCYALANYEDEILYVGLASNNIRGRVTNHLDTPEKRSRGAHGTPYWTYYLVCETGSVNPIERGWMNQAILSDGDLPILNKIYSPL